MRGGGTIAAVAATIVVLWLGPLGEFVEGSTNGQIRFTLLELLWGVIYLLVGLWSFGYVIVTLCTKRGTAERLRRLAVPAVLLLSWGVPRLVVRGDGYLRGFARWATAHVDINAIRDWSSTVPLDKESEGMSLEWWLPQPSGGISLLEVPRMDWPESVTRIDPDAVGVFQDRSGTILLWRRGGWSHNPAIVIRNSDDAFAGEISTDEASGVGVRAIRSGVLVYVRRPVG